MLTPVVMPAPHSAPSWPASAAHSFWCFDGARRRQDIEPFVPTSGCGFVIVTTTNSTGWWHTARPLPVDSFTDDEAIACFEAYAGIEPGTHTDAAAGVVRRLGHVPL